MQGFDFGLLVREFFFSLIFLRAPIPDFVTRFNKFVRAVTRCDATNTYVREYK